MDRAIVTMSVLGVASAIGGCQPTPVSFDPNRTSLYTQAELRQQVGENTSTFDSRVYEEYIAQGKFYPSLDIARLRNVHDSGVTTALKAYAHDQQKKLIAIIGSGNPTLRCSDTYRDTAEIAWRLAHDGGYVLVTGGGPGQMEAANLGAYLAAEPETAIEDALEIMRSKARPDASTHQPPLKGSDKCEFDPAEYAEAADAVVSKYRHGSESLGIPTWFYGSEPTNRFATRIAKLFSNGIREDLLISIAVGGTLIVPGSAGTRQEIFMDAAKTYYGSFCYQSATVFFGTKAWGQVSGSLADPGNPGVYDLVRRYTPDPDNLLALTDDADEALAFFRDHPPKRLESEPVACRNMP